MKTKNVFASALASRRGKVVLVALLLCFGAGAGYGRTQGESLGGDRLVRDESGRIAYRITPEGERIDHFYDSQDRMIRISYPDKIESFEYDDGDRLVKMSSVPKGAEAATLTINYEYDGQGRVAVQRQSGPDILEKGYESLVVRYAYDADGKVTETVALVKDGTEVPAGSAAAGQ